MDSASSAGKKREGGETMKEKGFLKGLAYMIAGCGMVLFAIFGLLPGPYPGGAIGLEVAGILLGVPVTSGIFSRWIVAASMAMGVMASGIMFIIAAAAAGWLISTALYSLAGRRRIFRQKNMNRKGLGERESATTD
jgi:hypothetical protein